MQHSSWFQILTLSAVVMGLSHTIAKERICEPLRKRLRGKETWVGYLVSCPYCNSHWLAFVLVPLTGLRVIDIPYDWGLATRGMEWFLTAVFVAVMAAFLRIAFYFVDESQGLLRREIVKTEAETKVAQKVAAQKVGDRPSFREQTPSQH